MTGEEGEKTEEREEGEKGRKGRKGGRRKTLSLVPPPPFSFYPPLFQAKTRVIHSLFSFVHTLSIPDFRFFG